MMWESSDSDAALGHCELQGLHAALTHHPSNGLCYISRYKHAIGTDISNNAQSSRCIPRV